WQGFDPEVSLVRRRGASRASAHPFDAPLRLPGRCYIVDPQLERGEARRSDRGRDARYSEMSPMTRPTPEPIDPQHLVDLAANVMRAARFPFLATIDGDQPRVRPVSPVRTDGFTVYIANLRAYHKTVEIEANPKVELCYLDDGHDQVRITGIAEVVTDPAQLQAIWDENPLLRG